jgi:hypothetical protein
VYAHTRFFFARPPEVDFHPFLHRHLDKLLSGSSLLSPVLSFIFTCTIIPSGRQKSASFLLHMLQLKNPPMRGMLLKIYCADSAMKWTYLRWNFGHFNLNRNSPHAQTQEELWMIYSRGWLEHLTANAKVATVLDGILASSTQSNLRYGRWSSIE